MFAYWISINIRNLTLKLFIRNSHHHHHHRPSGVCVQISLEKWIEALAESSIVQSSFVDLLFSSIKFILQMIPSSTGSLHHKFCMVQLIFFWEKILICAASFLSLKQKGIWKFSQANYVWIEKQKKRVITHIIISSTNVFGKEKQK